jgi:hypothetical protein
VREPGNGRQGERGEEERRGARLGLSMRRREARKNVETFVLPVPPFPVSEVFTVTAELRVAVWWRSTVAVNLIIP